MTRIFAFHNQKLAKKLIIASAFAMTFMGAASWLAGDLIITPAYAQSAESKRIIDDAKAKGIIGETAAGYLAVVNGASPSPQIVNAMNEINIGRKSVYTRLAREQNVQVEVVAALTGEKQIAKAAPGEKVLTKDNRWVPAR